MSSLSLDEFKGDQSFITSKLTVTPNQNKYPQPLYVDHDKYMIKSNVVFLHFTFLCFKKHLENNHNIFDYIMFVCKKCKKKFGSH